MWTGGTSFFSTANQLFTKSHPRTGIRVEGNTTVLEAGSSKNDETPQIVFVHFSDGLKNISVDRQVSALAGGVGDARGAAAKSLAKTYHL